MKTDLEKAREIMKASMADFAQHVDDYGGDPHLTPSEVDEDHIAKALAQERASLLAEVLPVLDLYAETAGGIWGGDSYVTTIHKSDIELIPSGVVMIPYGGKAARALLARLKELE